MNFFFKEHIQTKTLILKTTINDITNNKKDGPFRLIKIKVYAGIRFHK
jgi:hypothetical protein